MPTSPVSDDLDPRMTPSRGDLAASWLRGRVEADKFVEPSRQIILAPVANLYKSPDMDQALDTQLLYGEPIDVLEVKRGWAWVQSARDSYVGYVRADHIGMLRGDTSPTHRVMNIGTFAYPAANMKNTPRHALSYGSLVKITGDENGFGELATGGFVPLQHLAPIDFYADEHVAEAFRFLGVPYLWGGRSHTGLDCSALVQLTLMACNIKCPRDSDMQETMPGKPVDRADLRSGDLVFFRGHVGIMVDENTMIHANDRAMAVSIDDLDEYIQWRGLNGKSPVKMFKRIV